MNLEDSNVLVLGLGISGRSAANFCAARGARVVAADEASEASLTGISDLDSSVELRVGGALPDPADFDLVVPSPGIPRDRYARRARRVWGDIELAGRALGIPIVAVTGTNGKSTTVLLVEAMLRAAGLRARAAGNVGTPALSLTSEALDVAVLEVSSFQLEAVESFRPRVSAILNLSPDHLDRHGDFESYRATKCRIFANQRGEDVVVLNFDDPKVHALEDRVHSQILGFSRKRPLARGVFFDTGSLVVQMDEGPLRLPLDGLRIEGVHNLENVLAALAIVVSLGVDPVPAVRALASFEGLPHRCETVAVRDQVRFVDDSKATNPGAALGSLVSFHQPVIWIAGGRDKGLDFSELAEAASRRVELALLIGEAAAKLEAALEGKVATVRVKTLAAAVELAAQRAKPGDVVLLAPACASFDQFASFEERGDVFRRCVESLANQGGDR